MLSYNDNYNKEINFTKLNTFFSENSEKNKVVFEKLKKENDQNRQSFIEKMVSRIITKEIISLLKKSKTDARVQMNETKYNFDHFEVQNFELFGNRPSGTETKNFDSHTIKESEMGNPVSDSFIV